MLRQNKKHLTLRPLLRLKSELRQRLPHKSTLPALHEARMSQPEPGLKKMHILPMMCPIRDRKAARHRTKTNLNRNSRIPPPRRIRHQPRHRLIHALVPGPNRPRVPPDPSIIP